MWGVTRGDRTDDVSEEVEDGLWADTSVQAFTFRLPNGEDGLERVLRVSGLSMDEARAINRALRQMERKP